MVICSLCSGFTYNAQCKKRKHLLFDGATKDLTLVDFLAPANTGYYLIIPDKNRALNLCDDDLHKLVMFPSGKPTFNTLRPRQNGRHFADYILKCIFLNENV